MDKFASTLLKIVVLSGGAFLGALLARWFDELLTSRAMERSEHDRTRYEQGLGPMETQRRQSEEAP